MQRLGSVNKMMMMMMMMMMTMMKRVSGSGSGSYVLSKCSFVVVDGRGGRATMKSIVPRFRVNTNCLGFLLLPAVDAFPPAWERHAAKVSAECHRLRSRRMNSWFASSSRGMVTCT